MSWTVAYLFMMVDPQLSKNSLRWAGLNFFFNPPLKAYFTTWKKTYKLLDWCCFCYFVKNSLIALLEALCALVSESFFVNQKDVPMRLVISCTAVTDLERSKRQALTFFFPWKFAICSKSHCVEASKIKIIVSLWDMQIECHCAKEKNFGMLFRKIQVYCTFWAHKASSKATRLFFTK